MRSTNGENGRESLRVIGARPRLNRTTLSWTFRPEDRFDREKVNEAALNNDKSLSGFTSMVISARAMWIG